MVDRMTNELWKDVAIKLWRSQLRYMGRSLGKDGCRKISRQDGAVDARYSAGLSIEGTVVQSHLPLFRNLGNFVHPTFACVLRKRH